MNPSALAHAIKRFTAALSDIRAAHAYAAADQPDTLLTCFHCQQAVEGMLKGVLAFHEQPIEEDAAIGVLLRQAKQASEAAKAIPDAAASLGFYSPQAVAREDVSIPSLDEMAVALSFMDTVRDTLNKALYPIPGEE